MDTYAITTIGFGLAAALITWLKPYSLLGYVVFFISYQPLVFRQLTIDKEPQIALATFVVATILGVMQLIKRKKQNS